jgi:hypothetical protein
MMLRILCGLAFATGCFTQAERIATTLPPVPILGGTHVHIVADDGAVRVFTADVSQVELQVFARGYEIPKDLEVSMLPNGDRVDIVAKTRHEWRFLDWWTSRSLRLEVRVPRNVDVEVRSGDGSVEVDSIAGNLDVQTGDGHIAVRGARGAVRLRTGDGSIEGRDIDGSVDADTRDGHVRLEGRFDGLTVHTGDGRLVANAWPGSRMLRPWELQTGDGSVELGLPGGLGARIDASTGDGRVRSNLPLQAIGPSRLAGDINGGGPPIIVRTGDGSIQLNQI